VDTQPVIEKSDTRSSPDPMTSKAPYGLDDLMALSAVPTAITPEMARHLRKTMHFERQRPISEDNVKRLAEEMRNGWFMAGTAITICDVAEDGRSRIINGNHTLEAVHASGVTLPLVIIRKKVATLNDAAHAYAAFDLQKMRTWRDTLLATGFDQKVEMANFVVPAVGLIMQGFAYQKEKTNTSREARLRTLPEYIPASHIIAAALKDVPVSGRRVVQRAAILAVALYTTRHQPSAGSEFWGSLARDDGLKANDPRKALLRYAMNNPASGSNSRPLHARAAMLAWNAWWEKRMIEAVKPNQMVDIRISGTPMHKGSSAK